MRYFGFASCLGLIVAACSGAKETDLLAPGSAAPLEPASTDRSDPTGGRETDGTGTDTGTPTGKGGGSSGTGGGSSGNPGPAPKPDAGTDAGGGTVDAGTPPTTTTMPCGQANGNVVTCNVGTQVCCATFTEGSKTTFACKPAGPNACGSAVRISCNDAADCPADRICCGLLSQTTGYSSIECRSSCISTQGVRAVHFCDPAAPVDECIGYGGTCIKSLSVPGYHVCG